MRPLSSHPNPRLCGGHLPEGTVGSGLFYRFMRWICQLGMCTFWRLRVFNRHYEPAEGSAVYISNHQSFLDPMPIGMGLRRPMNYMARASLFRMPGFRQLIASVNAFPVRRGTADLAAMKEAIRRLKAGGQVAVFAEGTRTRDGSIGPFLPGVALLSQRVADWTVPVLIDGAFEIWPRTQALPSTGFITVCYAKPIARAEARKLSAEQLIARVRQTIIDMQTDTRRRMGKPAIEYP